MLRMTLRGLFWAAAGSAAIGLAWLIVQEGVLPWALFTLGMVVAAAAWLRMPRRGGEACLCGHRPPGGSRFCNSCGARLPGPNRERAGAAAEAAAAAAARRGR